MFDKVPPEITRMSQHDREQPDRVILAGSVIEEDVEVRKIHLSLMPGRRLKAYLETALAYWLDFPNQVSQSSTPTRIPHRPDFPQ